MSETPRQRGPGESDCPRCYKPPGLCVCAFVRELPTRHHVLFLQHPQEPDKDLGTARLANLCLPNSTLKVGLSWPNLKSALGREVVASQWMVLYLGSASMPADRPLGLVDKKGALIDEQRRLLSEVEGVVVLDGTWSQAKTLWWRNAWLLKLRRGVLGPGAPSMYGKMRKEPRRECLSTLESAGRTLTGLGEDPSVEAGLREAFGGLLTQYKDRRSSRRPAPADVVKEP